MPDRTEFDSSLAYAPVEPAVLARWPEYHALLIVVRGLRGGPSDRAGDVALCRAEEIARTRLVSTAPEELPEIASWRDASAPSASSPAKGVAASRHSCGELPAGCRASTGSPVWRDDLGVTCRRWNWRQCVRTRLDASTENVLFILDGLAPIITDALQAAGDALIAAVTADAPGASATTRLLGAQG